MRKKKEEKKWEMGWETALGVCSSGGVRKQKGTKWRTKLFNKQTSKRKKRKFDYLFNPHNRKIRIKGNISKGRKETI